MIHEVSGGLYLGKGEISLALEDYHAAEQKLTNVSAPLQAALKKLDHAGRIIRVERIKVLNKQL